MIKERQTSVFKNKTIGVIVPVYKVEKYIAECIESILAQTYTNFRLILVNDGTPDNAGKICDEYANKDPRITVIHQENAGVTRARARGVEEAEDCEFITFVDGDDMITPIALQIFIANIDDNTDIAMSKVLMYNANDIKKLRPNTKYKIQNNKKISLEEFKSTVIFLRGGIGGKIYRKELFDKNTFNIPQDIIFGEDAIMNLRLSFNTNKQVAFINSEIYLYNQHEESCCSIFPFSEEYEERLIDLLYESIPKNKQCEYIGLFIKRRLWAWERRYNNSYHKPKWSGSKFHEQLKSDIIKYSIDIHFFSKALLIYTNPFMRSLIIILRKSSFFLKKLYRGVTFVLL